MKNISKILKLFIKIMKKTHRERRSALARPVAIPLVDPVRTSYCRVTSDGRKNDRRFFSIPEGTASIIAAEKLG